MRIRILKEETKKKDSTIKKDTSTKGPKGEITNLLDPNKISGLSEEELRKLDPEDLAAVLDPNDDTAVTVVGKRRPKGGDIDISGFDAELNKDVGKIPEPVPQAAPQAGAQKTPDEAPQPTSEPKKPKKNQKSSTKYPKDAIYQYTVTDKRAPLQWFGGAPVGDSQVPEKYKTGKLGAAVDKMATKYRIPKAMIWAIISKENFSANPNANNKGDKPGSKRRLSWNSAPAGVKRRINKIINGTAKNDRMAKHLGASLPPDWRREQALRFKNTGDTPVAGARYIDRGLMQINDFWFWMPNESDYYDIEKSLSIACKRMSETFRKYGEPKSGPMLVKIFASYNWPKVLKTGSRGDTTRHYGKNAVKYFYQYGGFTGSADEWWDGPGMYAVGQDGSFKKVGNTQKKKDSVLPSGEKKPNLMEEDLKIKKVNLLIEKKSKTNKTTKQQAKIKALSSLSAPFTVFGHSRDPDTNKFITYLEGTSIMADIKLIDLDSSNMQLFSDITRGSTSAGYPYLVFKKLGQAEELNTSQLGWKSGEITDAFKTALKGKASSYGALGATPENKKRQLATTTAKWKFINATLEKKLGAFYSSIISDLKELKKHKFESLDSLARYVSEQARAENFTHTITQKEAKVILTFLQREFRSQSSNLLGQVNPSICKYPKKGEEEGVVDAFLKMLYNEDTSLYHDITITPVREKIKNLVRNAPNEESYKKVLDIAIQAHIDNPSGRYNFKKTKNKAFKDLVEANNDECGKLILKKHANRQLIRAAKMFLTYSAIQTSGHGKPGQIQLLIDSMNDLLALPETVTADGPEGLSTTIFYELKNGLVREFNVSDNPREHMMATKEQALANYLYWSGYPASGTIAGRLIDKAQGKDQIKFNKNLPLNGADKGMSKRLLKIVKAIGEGEKEKMAIAEILVGNPETSSYKILHRGGTTRGHRGGLEFKRSIAKGKDLYEFKNRKFATAVYIAWAHWYDYDTEAFLQAAARVYQNVDRELANAVNVYNFTPRRLCTPADPCKGSLGTGGQTTGHYSHPDDDNIRISKLLGGQGGALDDAAKTRVKKIFRLASALARPGKINPKEELSMMNKKQNYGKFKELATEEGNKSLYLFLLNMFKESEKEKAQGVRLETEFKEYFEKIVDPNLEEASISLGTEYLMIQRMNAYYKFCKNTSVILGKQADINIKIGQPTLNNIPAPGFMQRLQQNAAPAAPATGTP